MTSALLCLFLSAGAEAGPRGALVVRVLDGGEPAAGLEVAMDGVSRTTDGEGRVRFEDLELGTYRLSAGGLERTVTVGDLLATLHIDIRIDSPVDAGRFGRSDLDREGLMRLPNAGTTSSVLETLEPLAVTNRIDVAGVESATDPLWSVRGSSFTANRVQLDGLDVTDPAGGAPLFYPDVGFHEEIVFATSAHGPEVAGPGTELRFVTRKAAPSQPSIRATLGLRATGAGLQSENLDAEDRALGIEPREMRRYAAARFDLGAKHFYAAASGLDMATRVPKFGPEERFDVVSVLGKLTTERLSLLGLFQRLGRPTFGARPDHAPETTLDSTETFQVVQGSIRGLPFRLRFGLARGDFDSSFPAESTAAPVRDLATGAVAGAPVVIDRERLRFTAAGTGTRELPGHTVSAGFEISHAGMNASERVPGNHERLLVDGEAHAVDIYSGDVSRRAGLNRVALYAQDAFFFDFLGRAFRMSAGLRFDDSRGGGVGWTHVSGTLRGGISLTPSSEVHFGGGIYPHALTTQLHRADEALTWVRRRWTDANRDGGATENELGAVLRRGGGDYTTMASDLPRPLTYELTVGIEKRFGNGFLRFSGYQRWEMRLLQTTNVGIDPSSYRTFLFHDVGIDGVLGSLDDVEIPVYDQTAQFGEDAFLLTHPDGLDGMAQGVDLLVGFDHGRFAWRLSGRAYRDVGSGNPGNEAVLNDTGVIGELFDDPNSLTNAEGRLFFDRAFTGKLALTAQGPLGLRFGTAVRYWDGQPFARHLYFPDLGQGFVLVQAFPRGRLRYAFNMTVDVRAERDFELGRTRVSLALDAFNLFNQSLHTAEVVRSGMEFRDPTFVQPARTIVLEARLLF